MASLFRSKSLNRKPDAPSGDLTTGPLSAGAVGTGSGSSGGGSGLIATLSRRGTAAGTTLSLGRSRSNAQPSQQYPLSDSGLPISAPTSVVAMPPINYSLRSPPAAAAAVGGVAGTLLAANALISGAGGDAKDKEVAPNPVKLHTSKAAQTGTLKWWQAPGMTKETEQALADANKDRKEPGVPGSSSFDSLPRQQKLGSHSLGRNNTVTGGSNENSGGIAAILGAGSNTTPRAKFHQFEELAIIKTQHDNLSRGPQFGTVPAFVDRCGAGATLSVLHNFTGLAPSDLSVSRDDIVRILRVDPGGWVLVKLLKLGGAGANGAPVRGAVAPESDSMYHRAAVQSAVGMEGIVPIGVLDTMKTKRLFVQPGGGGGGGTAGNMNGLAASARSNSDRSFDGGYVGRPPIQNGSPLAAGAGMPTRIAGPRPMRSLSNA
ncbi:hypothetical protein HDU82_004621 [Entophlyctis luteolus]|nr:hypothetical protein HDU82_004621 [Entophlyctis luteolus]KAJ3394700.1 hypothetical protein HDU84_006843 [Entophlyctis sp. JEL0112]